MRSFAALPRSMAKLRVEVVYAMPDAADVVPVSLNEGATVSDALRESGLIERHPALRDGEARLGIHGEEVPPERRVADGERVEVYRPLAVDPKEARRRRASGKA